MIMIARVRSLCFALDNGIWIPVVDGPTIYSRAVRVVEASITLGLKDLELTGTGGMAQGTPKRLIDALVVVRLSW